MFSSTYSSRRHRRWRGAWRRMLATVFFVLASTGLMIGLVSPAEAQPPKTYPVAVDSDGLRVRKAPSTSAPVVGGLFPGDRVRIECTARGTTVRGPFGSSNVWDKIGTTDRWVSDAYIKTGSDNPVAPPCDARTQPPTPPSPPPPPLNVRSDCGGKMIHSVHAYSGPQGLTISTEPSGFGRWVNMQSGRLWEDVWRCLDKVGTTPATLGLTGDQVDSMRKQFDCHVTNSAPKPWGGWTGGDTWDVESWRPNVSERWARYLVLKHECNWD